VIAVMSPSGFIGRHVVEALLQRGHTVRGFARNPMPVPGDWQGRFTCSRVDFSASVEDLRVQLQDVTSVIHCAGHYEADAHGLAEYVQSAERLSLAAAQTGVKRFVLLSSVAVYGSGHQGFVPIDCVPTPDTAYARSRLQAEQCVATVLAAGSVQLNIVRVPAVVGAGMRAHVLRRFFGGLRTGLFIHPGRAAAVFPCVGVQRLAAALALVAEPGRAELPLVIQLSDTLSWREIADIHGMMVRGRQPWRIALPAGAVRRLVHLLGLKLAGALTALDNMTSYADTSAVLTRIETLPETQLDIQAVVAESNPHRPGYH
jgi:nucleoside-diphosphate-sugar epimerase